MQNVVAPIRQVTVKMAGTAAKLFRKDEYRALTTEDDLRWVPPCMHLPIVYFQPIRRMLEEERIEGFGIDPSTLADEDPYENLCKSGVVDDIHSSNFPDGEITIPHYEATDDPKLTWEEVDKLRATREFLAELLLNEDTAHYDPTNYPAIHS